MSAMEETVELMVACARKRIEERRKSMTVVWNRLLWEFDGLGYVNPYEVMFDIVAEDIVEAIESLRLTDEEDAR